MLFAHRRSFQSQEAALFFRRARRILRHPAFDILIAQRTDSIPKLVVVTSRRVGNAPERNRIRRRIKAIFYELQPLSSAYDCALIIKKPGTLLTFAELVTLICSSLASYTQPTPDAH